MTRIRAKTPRLLSNVVLSLALIGTVLTGCGSDKKKPTQLPNPASVFCEQQGGTVDLTSGICSLPDGTKIDEWEYYRSKTGGSTGIANPASVFCEQHGGTVDLQTGICSLPDGTKIDEWEYFRKNSPG